MMTEEDAKSLCSETAREIDADNLRFANAAEVYAEVFNRLSRRLSPAEAAEAIVLSMLGEELARALRK